jgi:hypothetical protein
MTMIFKNKTVLILIIFCAATILPAGVSVEFSGQDEGGNLAPKYRAFLAETQMIMHQKEKEVFLRLKSDQERDIYIASFWQQQGRRQQSVRANINLLMLMRMVQTLDLNEDQIAKILPVLNQIEKEKQRLQNGILKELREIRILLRDESPDEQSLAGKVKTVKDLEEKLSGKEMELNTFIEQHLSVVQQAKYILFAQDFYREMRDKLNDARSVQQRLREMNKRK